MVVIKTIVYIVVGLDVSLYNTVSVAVLCKIFLLLGYSLRCRI